MQIEVDGERLLLTIDRVVEQGCDNPDCYIDDGVGGASCTRCHGTGRVKVRVTGWVEVGISHFPENLGVHTIGREYNVGGHETEDMCKTLIKSVVTAFLAGTLPDAIAANLKRENVDN